MGHGRVATDEGDDMNFRIAPALFIPSVLTRKLKPNAPRATLRAGFMRLFQRSEAWLVSDLSMPARNWSKYDAPTHALIRPRVNVARRKIEAAQREARLPAMLKRQAD